MPAARRAQLTRVSRGTQHVWVIYRVEPHVVWESGTTGGVPANNSTARSFSSSHPVLAAMVASGDVTVHNGPNPVAAWPALRAALPAAKGAPRNESLMLGVFHTLRKSTGRYANYAYTFSAAPPFAVRHVSARLPTTEAEVRPGAETPRGARMTFVSGLVEALAPGKGDAVTGTHVLYGSSNSESRLLTLTTDELVALFTRADAGGAARKKQR